MKKTLTCFLCATLLLLGGITAAAADDSPTVLSVGVWADDEGERLLAAFAGIEEALGIEIEIMRYPTDGDFWDNIPAQIATGTAPDLISCTNEHYLQYIQQGLFLPLNDYIGNGTISTEGISDSAMGAWTIDGQVYGIPYALNPGVFIVNNSMWKELGLGDDYPTTWDEVVEVCKEYKDITGEPAWCFNIQEYHLTNLALSFGGGWDFGKTINSAENAAALQFIIDTYKEGYSVTPTELGLGWDGEVMMQQEALFSTGGAWYQPNFIANAPDVELKYLAVPSGNGADGNATAHSAALVALKSTQAPEAAADAIGYAFANEGLFKAVVEVTQVVPANAGYFDLYRESFPDLAVLVDYLDSTEPFAYPAQSKEFADALVTLMQEAMFDENSTLTGQEIVDELAAKFAAD